MRQLLRLGGLYPDVPSCLVCAWAPLPVRPGAEPDRNRWPHISDVYFAPEMVQLSTSKTSA